MKNSEKYLNLIKEKCRVQTYEEIQRYGDYRMLEERHKHELIESGIDSMKTEKELNQMAKEDELL